MILEIFKHWKHPQRPRIYMDPCILIISWQVLKDMWAPTLELIHCQPQIMFLVGLTLPTDTDYMRCTRQPLSRQGISHTWAVTDPSTQELSCIRSSYDPSASHGNVCMQDISRPQENIYPLIVWCISPSLDIHHLLHYAYLRCTKTWETKINSSVFLSSLEII